MIEERYVLEILSDIQDTEVELRFYDKEGNAHAITGQLMYDHAWLIHLFTVDLQFDTTQVETIGITDGLTAIQLAKPALLSDTTH